MGENVVLVLFAAFPLILAWGLLLFFRKHRLHRRGRLSLLLTGNVLVFVFLCSVVVLSGEIYYRFLYDSTESFGLAKTTIRWFERHFQKNTNGLRDSIDYQPEIQAGHRRATFLGDSFTAGHGIPDVEDRFANLVRGMSPSREVHVIAVCGWDTGSEISALRALCESDYELDLVVLAYCLNDISDISLEWRNVLKRIEDFSEPGFLVDHSFLCNTIYYRWKAAGDPDISNYYRFVEKNYKGQIWEMQKRRLRFLRDEVHSNGGRLLVVTFPFYHALGDDYRYQWIHELLDRWWTGIEVPHLDLLPKYRSYGAEELVVSRYDAHPNERAHAIAAEAIHDFLLQQAPRKVD